MTKFLIKIFSAVLFLLAIASADKTFAIGDPPYWSGTYAYEPALDQPGCLIWNWQQYSWYNNCPVYVRPKAIMYPYRATTVLRTKG